MAHGTQLHKCSNYYLCINPHLKLNGCEDERVAVHHRVRLLLWHCVGKDVENLQHLSKSNSNKDSRLVVATMMRFYASNV